MRTKLLDQFNQVTEAMITKVKKDVLSSRTPSSRGYSDIALLEAKRLALDSGSYVLFRQLHPRNGVVQDDAVIALLLANSILHQHGKPGELSPDVLAHYWGLKGVSGNKGGKQSLTNSTRRKVGTMVTSNYKYVTTAAVQTMANECMPRVLRVLGLPANWLALYGPLGAGSVTKMGLLLRFESASGGKVAVNRLMGDDLRTDKVVGGRQKYSSAAGLFQNVSSNWKDAASKFGRAYGAVPGPTSVAGMIDPYKKWVLDCAPGSPADLRVACSVLLHQRVTHFLGLRAKMGPGRIVTEEDLYLCHNQGLTGALRVLAGGRLTNASGNKSVVRAYGKLASV